MENAVNDAINVMPAAVTAVTSPLQLVALVLMMIFVITLLLAISNIMDKKTKLQIDKDTAVRIAERNAELSAIKLEAADLKSDFKKHVEVEHAKYDEEYAKLHDAMIEIRVMLKTIQHSLRITATNLHGDDYVTN